MVPSPTANGGARAAFNAAQQQRTITCNLALLSPSKPMITRFLKLINAAADASQQKIRLTGIIIVMYTPQPGPPARLYMLVADKDGVAGVTVWGDTVNQLTNTTDVIGKAVSIPGCTISFYNGKRSLNVPRNHVIQFPENSPHTDWWLSKLQAEAVTTQQLLALPDHTIANLFAVCASICREEKMQCEQHIVYTPVTLPQLTRCSQWFYQNSGRVDYGR
jgi:hypothetical protein